MHKSASGGAQSASGGEPDAQTKVHLEVSQMHKSASGGAQSASGGAQMSVPAAQMAVLTAQGRCPRGGKYVRAELVSPMNMETVDPSAVPKGTC